jgi:hypothetical protein
MKTNRKRVVLSRWSRGRVCGSVRSSAQITGQFDAMRRHRRWTERILERYSRASWRGARHQEAMILALAPRAWIFLYQQFAAATWISHRGGPGAASARKLGRAGLAAVPQFFATPFSRESAGERRFSVPATSAEARSCHGTLRRRRLEGPWSVTDAATQEPRLARIKARVDLRLSWLLRKMVPLVVAGHRAEAQAAVRGAQDIAVAVTQKHRRIEERRLVTAREPMSLPALPPASPIAGGSQRRQTLSRRGLTCEAESDGRSTPQRQEFPFNVARVTDEILKQLDRRVIAARERMGRI